MWPELGWVAGQVLRGVTLPITLIAVAVMSLDRVRISYLILIVLGFVVITVWEFVRLRLLGSNARKAAAGLGPPGIEPSTAGPPRRLTPAARAIRPVLRRLDRAWR